LAPRVPANLGAWQRSRGICACKGVDERTIQQVIINGASTLDAVMRACGAGSECGSCKPEIQQLLQSSFAEAS
jgi:assimilatory nitrate reductase catalytic subunit